MVYLRLGLACCLLVSPLAVGALGAAQAPQAGVPDTKPQAPATYRFAFLHTLWSEVLEWLANTTELPVVHSWAPKGFFTFIPEKGPRGDKRYTIGEILDVLNESITASKFIFVRGQTSICIVPGDSVLEYPAVCRTVSRDELVSNGLGKTEQMRFVYRPNNIDVNLLLPTVKKGLGPVGQVFTDKQANRLILIDTAANLRAVVARLESMSGFEGAVSLSVWCRYCKAAVAAEKCRMAVGVPRRPWQAPGHDFGVFADVAANVVHLRGPSEKVAMARAVIAAADVPRGSAPPAGELPVLKTYRVPDQQAEAVADALRELYQRSPGVRVVAVGGATVAVYAPVSVQRHVESLLSGAEHLFVFRPERAGQVSPGQASASERRPGIPRPGELAR
jgi:hypothetical protein